ncbi:unnamed protein product, partial [Clonostachys rosea]
MKPASKANEIDEPRTSDLKRSNTVARHGRVARDKKKAQNRAAQRSFREKRESHLHYLESFVEAVKSTQHDDDGSDGNQRLLRAHLELLEDYRRLHESFITLRQKLQSIGQSALIAADDDSLDEVERAGRKYNDNTTETQANADLFTHSESTMDIIRSNGLASQPLDAATVGVRTATDNQTIIDQAGSPNPSIQQVMNVRDMSLPEISYLSHFTLNSTVVVVDSKSLFADKVEGACKLFLSQISESAIELEEFGNSQALNPSEIKNYLASAAVRLISELSGLEILIYGSDFHIFLQRMLFWRLSNSLESKLELSEPFQPTPLQYSLTDYPVIIDFIPWASIRDQLILFRHMLDLDVVCRELTLHAVVELPERSLAVRVYDSLLRGAMDRQSF